MVYRRSSGEPTSSTLLKEPRLRKSFETSNSIRTCLMVFGKCLSCVTTSSAICKRQAMCMRCTRRVSRSSLESGRMRRLQGKWRRCARNDQNGKALIADCEAIGSYQNQAFCEAANEWSCHKMKYRTPGHSTEENASLELPQKEKRPLPRNPNEGF